MKLLPYWMSYCLEPLPAAPLIHYAYKPNKPPKSKATAGTGGFKLKRKKHNVRIHKPD